MHLYPKVPGLVKAGVVFVSPTFSGVKSNEPSSAVAVWGILPVFLNVTVSPVLTVIVSGTKT